MQPNAVAGKTSVQRQRHDGVAGSKQLTVAFLAADLQLSLPLCRCDLWKGGVSTRSISGYARARAMSRWKVTSAWQERCADLGAQVPLIRITDLQLQ